MPLLWIVWAFQTYSFIFCLPDFKCVHSRGCFANNIHKCIMSLFVFPNTACSKKEKEKNVILCNSIKIVRKETTFSWPSYYEKGQTNQQKWENRRKLQGYNIIFSRV